MNISDTDIERAIRKQLFSLEILPKPATLFDSDAEEKNDVTDKLSID